MLCSGSALDLLLIKYLCNWIRSVKGNQQFYNVFWKQYIYGPYNIAPGSAFCMLPILFALCKARISVFEE